MIVSHMKSSVSATVWKAISSVLILGMAGTMLALPSRYLNIRSSHAEPASTIPGTPVMVTDESPIFHASGCKYIHGKNPHAMNATEAVARGYVPCVRCMGSTIAH